MQLYRRLVASYIAPLYHHLLLAIEDLQIAVHPPRKSLGSLPRLLLTPYMTLANQQAMRVAKKLKSVGAKMYGAYWCTHCFHQKEMLGEQGMKKVQYVEW